MSTTISPPSSRRAASGDAGLIYALYQTQVWFFQGFTAGLIAFTAAVMGGIEPRGTQFSGADHRRDPADLDNWIGGGYLLLVFAYLVVVMVFDRRASSARRREERDDQDPRPPADALGGLGAGDSRAGSGRAVPIFRPPLDGFVDDCILARAPAYVVMALGLNIVVGFAGLLDLGYVAFYALRRAHRRLVRLRSLHRDRW